MNDMMFEATDGLRNGNGGGHIPAAGGRVHRDDLAKFKERVFKYLKEHPAGERLN